MRILLLCDRASDPARRAYKYMGNNGLGESSWQRKMNALENLRLVEPYVHGGYVLTDHGRAVGKRLFKEFA